jgi:UDP-glucose 4-epimerase
MKILLVGGGGYLGSHFANKYNYIHDITVHSRNKINNIGNIRQINGDIKNEKVINKIQNYKVDCVIYFISISKNNCDINIRDAIDINVRPVVEILAGTKSLKKFIYISTFHVYNKMKLTNKEPIPSNLYGLTHYLSEKIVISYGENKTFDYKIIRLSNGYGAPMDLQDKNWELVINDFFRSSYINNKINIKGDLGLKKNFIYIEKICYTLNRLIISNNTKKIINLNENYQLRLLDVALLMAQYFDNDHRIKINILHKNKTIPNNIIKKYGREIEKKSSIDVKYKKFIQMFNENFNDMYRMLCLLK